MYPRNGIFLKLQPYLVKFSSNRLTQTASVTMYMEMWHVDHLNNATELAEISAKIYLTLRSSFKEDCGDGII